MGPGQKFLTRVGSDIYGFGLNFENFPYRMRQLNPENEKTLLGIVN